MFSKFKEKLKSALKVFSSKIEEESEKVKEETIEKEETAEEKIKETKKEKFAEKTEPEKVEKKEELKKPVFFEKIKKVIITKKISEEKFEELFWDLELVLLENNVAVEIVHQIKEKLKADLVEKALEGKTEEVIKNSLKETITKILTLKEYDLINQVKSKQPFVIAFFGINGSGKTTTIAKIAHLLQKNNLKVVLAASDTFRAAAIQQLEEWAKKLNTKLIKHDYGADATAVAFDAVRYAEKNRIDAVLIDTAGRLHSNVNLMNELKKICRVIKPDLKIFVGESLTGNDCLEQARRFEQSVGIDALILTKTDVDEKGGTILSLSSLLNKPILYLGSGQGLDDFKKFDKEEVIKSLGF